VLATISDKKIGVSLASDSSLIDHYEADVRTAQDYYPFGMIMSGRMLTTLSIPGRTFSGTTQVNGYTLPTDLTLTSRAGNQPTSYVASDLIDLNEGFESGDNDDVTAYIADGSYAGGGNGSNDAGIAGGGKYRYGFNGKENDNEVKGVGDQVDYGMRVYDPRAGRFMSVDPLTKKYAFLTPYQYASNNPIHNIDIDGLEGGWWHRFIYDPVNTLMQGASLEDLNEAAGQLNNITPPGAIINGGIQAITGKDPIAWKKASRIDGVGQAVIGGIFSSTISRFLKPGITVNLERQMAQNAAASISKQTAAANGTMIIEEGSSFANEGEKRVVQKLVSEGKSVLVKAEVASTENSIKSGRNADILVNGIKVEIKTISDAADLSKAIKDRLSKATGQAKTVILDLIDQKGATLEDARKGVYRYFGQSKGNMKEVRVIGKDFDEVIKNKNYTGN